MNKLEQAVKEQDAQYKSNPNFLLPTIKDEAIKRVIDMSFNLLRQENENLKRYTLEQKRVSRQIDSLHFAAKVLHGEVGFLRCTQGWKDLQSGFTAFEEVVSYILDPCVEVSLQKLPVTQGMELWHIDAKGMMTLIDCIRDSND